MMHSSLFLCRINPFRLVNDRQVSCGLNFVRQVMFVRKIHTRRWSTLYVSMKTHKEIYYCFPRLMTAPMFCTREKEHSTSEQVNELLLQLDSDIRHINRVKWKDVEMLLYFMKNGVVTDYDQYGVKLLEWIAYLMPDMSPSSRISFAHSVWKTLESFDTIFTTEHYNALLKCYAANNFSVSVRKFLENMGPVRPDQKTYEILLDCVCATGDVEQATYVIQLMKENNIPISEATFNSLIVAHARGGDIKSSVFVLDAMRAAKLDPSANTYTAMLQNYAEVGNFEQMKIFYEDQISKEIEFKDIHLMNICRSLAITQHHHLIPEFLALVPDYQKKFTLTVYNMVLELVHMHCEEAALQLLLHIPLEVGTENDEHPCAFFVHEMCQANTEPSCIIKLCCLLEETGVFPRALLRAAEASLHFAKCDLTIALFHALSEKGETMRVHYFWPIFKQRAKLEGEKGVITTLKDMQLLGVTPDFHTLLDYVLPSISTNDPETTVQKLQPYGVSVRQSLTPVAASLLFKRRLNAVVDICEHYPTKLDFHELLQPLAETFVSKRLIEPVIYLLQTAAKHTKDDLAGQLILEILTMKTSRFKTEDLLKLLKGYKDGGIYISDFAADMMAQHLKNGGADPKLYDRGIALLELVVQSDIHIASANLLPDHIAHPRDMNLEELECHLVELKSKNMNTRGVLRRLLQLHCKFGNVKRVAELRKEFEEIGFEFSLGMLASIFAMYVHVQDLDAAEKCLAKIMNSGPDFRMDEYKIIDYVTLLATKKQYKRAVYALERYAAAGNIVGRKSISRNCWELLNSIAAQGEPEQARHMLHLLTTLGFCAVSNALLGPLVRAHLNRGDTEGAVKEFQHCVTQFNKTPLQQELLNHLLTNSSETKEKQSLLESVVAAATTVHGSSSTNVMYAAALAESAKKEEIRNFIMKTGNDFKLSLLVSQCERMAKEGKLAPLARLAEACENLPNFDVSALYSLVLRVYDKQGNCDGALQLWIEMQERNIQPSTSFLQSLASLLANHNKEVPFDVPHA